MRDTLKPALSLLIICAVITFLVALMFNITKDTIEAREREELNNAMNEVLPGGAPFEDITTDMVNSGKEFEGVNLASAFKSEKGYVFSLTVNGYDGEMTVIVGINNNKKINGLRLGSNTETPSLGKRAEEEFFTSRFEGLGTDADIEESVDAISGATVTSKAVMKAAAAAAEYCGRGE